MGSFTYTNAYFMDNHLYYNGKKGSLSTEQLVEEIKIIYKDCRQTVTDCLFEYMLQPSNVRCDEWFILRNVETKMDMAELFSTYTFAIPSAYK